MKTELHLSETYDMPFITRHRYMTDVINGLTW